MRGKDEGQRDRETKVVRMKLLQVARSEGLVWFGLVSISDLAGGSPLPVPSIVNGSSSLFSARPREDMEIPSTEGLRPCRSMKPQFQSVVRSCMFMLKSCRRADGHGFGVGLILQATDRSVFTCELKLYLGVEGRLLQCNEQLRKHVLRQHLVSVGKRR